MKKTHMLFSVFAVFTTTLALAGTGTYLATHQNTSEPIVAEAIKAPTPPITAPINVAPPTEITLAEVVLPVAPLPKPVQKIAPRPAPVRAKVAASPVRQKEFVCEEQWNDSKVLVGGRYKRCEWK